MKNGMRAIHPGQILREASLAPLGVSAHALSQALRLARFFGGDAQSWLNMQMAYDLKLAGKTAARQIAKEVPTLAQLAASDERFALAA